MKRTVLTLILLFVSSLATGGNDIWQNLFKEKLQEAKQGNSNAQFDVAAMYQNGRGVKSDLSKAMEWYNKSAEQDNPKAVSRLKLLEANKERFNKTLVQAEKGNAESQYKLGKMYTKGVGVNIDHARATEAFENAANQGYAKAEYNLGLNYYEGSGVTKNRKTAYKWFKAAAEQGDPAAQYYLGKMFATGSGVKKNYTTSLEWLTKSVDGGFNQARGEMIDVSERMKAEKLKKTSPKPAKKASAKKKNPAVKTSKIKSKKVTAKTAKIETSKETPEFSIEDLMVAAWSRENAPVSYLPSAINNCRTEKNDIVCYSDNQSRVSGNNNLKFKTKSVMKNFSNDGTFNVTYRNLVINSTPIASIETEEDDGEVGSEDDSEVSAYKVKTGWGKEHTLECQLKDTGTVSCLKNKTHAFLLVSPHTVAGK
jgi:hypothetical protein